MSQGPVDLQRLAQAKQANEIQKLSNMYSFAAGLVNQGFYKVIEDKMTCQALSKLALMQAKIFFQTLDNDAEEQKQLKEKELANESRLKL